MRNYLSSNNPALHFGRRRPSSHVGLWQLGQRTGRPGLRGVQIRPHARQVLGGTSTGVGAGGAGGRTRLAGRWRPTSQVLLEQFGQRVGRPGSRGVHVWKHALQNFVIIGKLLVFSLSMQPTFYNTALWALRSMIPYRMICRVLRVSRDLQGAPREETICLSILS